MGDELKYDILVKEQLTDAMNRMARASEAFASKIDKLERDLRKLATESRQAEAATRDLGTHSERTGGRLDGLKSKVAGLAATAAGMAAGGLAAAGAGLAALSVLGVKTAADNETARVSFDLLLGSAEKAGAFLRDLNKFAAATPFDMPTLRDAASRLLAVGVNASDVIPLMTKLGDATAGMGTGAEGIGRAVYALQQMKQAGKVSLEDINQLNDAGIPALDALAAHFKKTVAQVRDMITKGQVKAEDLFGAIEKGEGPAFARLSGMMDKQSATLAGKWATFQDNLGQTMGKLFEPAMPGLGRFLDKVSTAIPQVIGYMAGLGDRIKNIFAGSDVGERFMAAMQKLRDPLLPEVKRAFDGIIKTISENKEGLTNLANFVINNVIPVVGTALVWAIRLLGWSIEWTITIVGHLEEAFQYLRHSTIANVRLLVDSSVAMLGLFLAAASAAFGWVPGLGPKLQAANEQFGKFVASVHAKLDELDGKKATIRIDAEVAPLAAGTAAHLYGGRKLMAAGGHAPAGTVATVGENGRETVVFGSDATVIPNGAGGGAGGGVNINVLVNATPGTNGAAVGAAAGAKIVEAIKAFEKRNGTRWRTT